MNRRGRPRRLSGARALPADDAVCSICLAPFNERQLRQDGYRSQAIRRNNQWFHQNCFRTAEIQRQRDEARSCTLNFPLYSNYAGCIFTGCIAEEAEPISKAVRFECISYKTVIIAKGSRVCHHHLGNLLALNFEETELIQTADEVRLSPSEATEIIRAMSKRLVQKKKEAVRALNFATMGSDRLKHTIGLDRDQFDRLMNDLHFDQESVRYKEFTIGVYLLKLKRGLSDEFIGSLFGRSRQTINWHISRARDILQRQFATKHLVGLRSLGPEGVWEHTSPVAKAMCPDDEPRSILVVDGTYIYTQKSMNFDFQRLSFSTYKYRNLFKMLMITTTDGLIVEACGPHEANPSDADLLEDYLAKANQYGELTAFDPQQVSWIVDRGFRNCIAKVRSLGFDILMPAFLDSKAKQKQMTWQQANETRFITKLRWVVEAVNGALKTYKYLDHTVVNRALPNAPHDFRNICALINFTRNGGLSSDRDQVEAITTRMHQQWEKPNLLAEVIKVNNLTCKTRPFEEVLMTDPSIRLRHFPRLSIDDLKIFFCGSYQLKLVYSYYWEHIKDNGRYTFHISQEVNDIHFGHIITDDIREESLQLYKCALRSRHSAAVKYHLFVLINTDRTGLEAIQEHFCQCKVGQRTVGCCAHLATLIWYLAYGRYLQQSEIRQPARALDFFFNEVERLPQVRANPQQAEETVDDMIDEMLEIEVVEEDEDDEEGEQSEEDDEDEDPEAA